jgi:hypothetical protein
MANQLPGPWKVQLRAVVASDGTPVLWIDPLGQLGVEPVAEGLLLAFPKMLELLMRLEGLSENAAAQLCMHREHVWAISEIPAILSEFDPSQHPQAMEQSLRASLVVGAKIRFQDRSESRTMLYGICSRVPGRTPEVDASLVEWHEIAASPERRVTWTETMEGGAGGTWSRGREQVLDLRVPDDLASPDRIWTVTKIEPKQEACDTGSQSAGPSSTEEVIHVTAVTERYIKTRVVHFVKCRFVLGAGRRGCRPFDSIQIVPRE